MELYEYKGLELQDKRLKKRKGYYKYIQSSIEFYLSDANLRSDSFIRNLLQENNEIDPITFTTFNRLIRVEADVEDIYRALAPSNILQITADGKIRRRYPIIEKSKEDVDWCSIYVEKIPPDATPDDLIKVFSAFGKVAKVTIPNRKIGRKIAGFGFVEFEEAQSRFRAIQAFRTYGAIINNNQAFSSTGYDDVYEEEHRLEIDEVQKIEHAKLENDTVAKVHPEIECTFVSKAKKNRKKKHKGKIRFMGVEIMSKTAWNRLRDRYITLQAFNRRRMKVQLSKSKRSPPHRPRIKSLLPGTIVVISMPEKIDETRARALKTELRLTEHVEYVDIEVNEAECYVRMHSADAANAFVAVPKRFPDFDLSILPPDKEKEYMNKIEEDRRTKFANSRKNISGKRKIVARAERQHCFKTRVLGDEHGIQRRT